MDTQALNTNIDAYNQALNLMKQGNDMNIDAANTTLCDFFTNDIFHITKECTFNHIRLNKLFDAINKDVYTDYLLVETVEARGGVLRVTRSSEEIMMLTLLIKALAEALEDNSAKADSKEVYNLIFRRDEGTVLYDHDIVSLEKVFTLFKGKLKNMDLQKLRNFVDNLYDFPVAHICTSLKPLEGLN